jgi:hypothetical protein
MKTKTLIFELEVPDYWDTNDIYGMPIDSDGNEVLNKNNKSEVDDHEGGVEAMLNKTLVFCEKKYNKRIDGEGIAYGSIFNKDSYIEQCRIIDGGKDD